MDQLLHERLLVLETEVRNIRRENDALRSTLHTMITTSITEHGAAIRALSASHQQKIGVWWTIGWVGAVFLVLIGGFTWLLEHQIQITLKP